MKRFVAKNLFFFMYFLSATFAFCQSRPCDILKTTLQSNKIPYSVQYLSNANGSEFPFSLIVKKEFEQKDASSDKELFIIVPQESAIKMQDEIVQFCKDLQHLHADYSVTLVLTANDYAQINLGEQTLQIPGTTTFLTSQNSEKEINAIVVSDYDKNSILFACNQRASPKILVKNVLKSCNYAKIPLKVHNSLLPFLRRGVVKSNPILEYLIENDIPSVHISAKEGIFTALEFFIENFDITDIKEWDSQYAILSIMSHPIFLDQRILVIILSVAIVLSFFLICFSFILGKTAFADLEKLRKIFYLGFVIIIVFLASFELSELFCVHTIKNYEEIPIVAFFLKLLLAILFYLTFSSLRVFFPVPKSAYLYGYLLNVSSFFNIMLFSLYDLSFLPYFVAIYFINFLFWKSKKRTSYIVFFSLSLLFFLPIVIFLFGHFSEIMLNLTNCSLWGNFLLSSLLTPIVLMVISYRISINRYKNYKISDWKEYLPKILITVAILVSVLVLSPLLNFATGYLHKNNKDIIKEVDGPFPYISVESKNDFYMGSQKITLKINSEPQVIRYIVKVGSNSLLPIFDANYNFDSFSEKNEAIFYFEENPPPNLNLEFTAKNNRDLDIEIICYTKLSENNADAVATDNTDKSNANAVATDNTDGRIVRHSQHIQVSKK